MNPWLDGHVDVYKDETQEVFNNWRWDEFSEGCREPWRLQQAFELCNNIGPGVDEWNGWESP